MLSDPLTILEGALLTAGQPMTIREMRLLFEKAYTRAQIKGWLGEIQQKWSGHAVHLVEVAGGWRFIGSVELQGYLKRLSAEKPVRYSRSLMETLAIIAYKQPVTRGDIEDLRGVSVNSNIMKTLQERRWIECVGHCETPGRPALWATTKRFLEDFSLASIRDLPLAEKKEEPVPQLPGFEDFPQRDGGAAEIRPEPESAGTETEPETETAAPEETGPQQGN